MATLAEAQEHKQAVADVVTLAEADLTAFWRSLDLSGDPKRLAKAVRAFVPELTTTYATATTALSADWYDNLRDEAAASAAFTAATLAAPDVSEVQDNLGYVLAPLFNGVAPEVAPEEMFKHLSALTEGVVVTSDRQTVRANMALDKAGPRYARHASANACAFCRMLATRGADYRSEGSATRVVLSRKRNTRKVGEKYHDNCRCIAVPVWGSKVYEEAPYVADWREAYYEATRRHGTSNTKAILADMRESMGLQH